MKLHTIYRGTMTKMNIDCSSETMEERKIWNNAFRIKTKQKHTQPDDSQTLEKQRQ